MPKKQSLLEIAKTRTYKTRQPNEISPEEIELAIAWMKDEISLSQCIMALQTKSVTGVYSRLATVLRQAYREGVIRVIMEND